METYPSFPFPRFFEGVPIGGEERDFYTFRLKEVRGKEIHDLGLSTEGVFSGAVSDYGLGLLQNSGVHSGKVKVSGLREQDTYTCNFGRRVKRAAVSPDGKTFLLAFSLSKNPYPWIPDFSEKYVEMCLFRTGEGIADAQGFHFFEGNYELLVLHLGFIDNETWYISGLTVGEMGRIEDLEFSKLHSSLRGSGYEAPASVRGKKWYLDEDIMYFDRDFFFPLGNGYFISEGGKHLSLCKLPKGKV